MASKQHPAARASIVVGAVVLAACAADGAGAPGDGGIRDARADPGGPDGATGTPSGRLLIAGAQLVDETGAPVRLTGVNWFGLETPTYAPHGLDQRSMTALLDQVKALGFNVLRVPFSSQLFDAGSTPNAIDLALNPELAGKTGPEILDRLITAAGERGLRVILDRHRPDSGAQSALWYTPG